MSIQTPFVVMASYDSFLDSFDDESIEETNSFVSGIRCTPMSKIGLRQMAGEDVPHDEISAAIANKDSQRKELRNLFDKKLRTYVGGILNEKGFWEFGLCGTEETVAKMSADAGDYDTLAKQWCHTRSISHASVEPSPMEKLGCFFGLIEDMGLDDVDELEAEDYSCRVIIKAIRKLSLLKIIPMSAWDEKRPKHFSAEEWLKFKRLLNFQCTGSMKE